MPEAIRSAIPARKRVLPRAHNLLTIPRLVRSPVGRWTLWHGTVFYAWPLLSAVARLYRRTAVARVRLIAIVGSLGKSSTAASVSAALRLPRATRPELNGWSWVALGVLRMRPRQLAHVIEVGIDGPGQMARLADVLRPDIVVVTCITSEHSRSLQSLHVTRNEKVQMVKRLSGDGVAVLNGDDVNVRWMATHSAARVVFFGLGPGNDIQASEIGTMGQTERRLRSGPSLGNASCALLSSACPVSTLRWRPSLPLFSCGTTWTMWWRIWRSWRR